MCSKSTRRTKSLVSMFAVTLNSFLSSTRSISSLCVMSSLAVASFSPCTPWGVEDHSDVTHLVIGGIECWLDVEWNVDEKGGEGYWLNADRSRPRWEMFIKTELNKFISMWRWHNMFHILFLNMYCYANLQSICVRNKIQYVYETRCFNQTQKVKRQTAANKR